MFTLDPLDFNIETIILLVFSAAFLLQLIYYFFFFIRIGGKKKPKSEDLLPISVVICARNEVENLRKHLPLIFAQDYPDFQVVVVNDASWDTTEDLLREFSEQHSNLHTIKIDDKNEVSFTKKQALTLGVKGAKHEHLILTDADCAPADPNWLHNMASSFSSKKNVVLGYSPYARKKGFLNKLIRFDTFFIGVQYLSFAKAGIPYMGVGRNLAYTKTLFFSVGGFKSHYHLSSGDDDLFINEVSSKQNTVVEVRPESHTISEPEVTWKAWWTQKQRHFTTAPHYRLLHKLLLFLWPMSTLIFYVSMIVLLFLQFWWPVVLGVYVIRLLLQFVIFNRAMRLMGDKDLLLLSPLLEVVFLILNPLIYGSNMLVKSNRWT